MIAKHVAIRSLGKSDFAGLVDYITDEQDKAERLGYAGNEAARSYLNGDIDAAAAAEYLTRYALMPAARAEQRVRFIDQYRTYVINYNLGQDLVAQFIEAKAPAGGAEAWAEFSALLSSPRLPSGLQYPFSVRGRR